MIYSTFIASKFSFQTGKASGHIRAAIPRPGRVLLPTCDLKNVAQRFGAELDPGAERATVALLNDLI